MKVHKLTWPLFLLCFAVTACEEKAPEAEPGAEAAAETTGGKAGEPPKPVPEAAKPAEPPPMPKEAPMPMPAEACAQLIGAVKAKDEAKVLAMSTPATAAALAAEGAKEHMMMVLSTAMCGAGKVEGDMATVAITAGEAMQELAFVKAPDGWKFDGAAYVAKYPAPEKAAKGAKGKSAKGKGAKGKKHHK